MAEKTDKAVADDDDLTEIDKPDCGCSWTRRLVMIFSGAAIVGVVLAVGICGIPVNVVGTVKAAIEGTGPNPNPGPNPSPGRFDDLVKQVADEAKKVRSPSPAADARALADSIETFVEHADSYPTLDAMFQALRHSTTAAIPPQSSAAWRPFNQRFDELFSALFDAGHLRTCLDAAEALGKVVEGLRQAAG